MGPLIDFGLSLDKAADSNCEWWITDLTGKVMTAMPVNSAELKLNSKSLPAQVLYLVSLRAGKGDILDQQKLIRQ